MKINKYLQILEFTFKIQKNKFASGGTGRHAVLRAVRKPFASSGPAFGTNIKYLVNLELFYFLSVDQTLNKL